MSVDRTSSLQKAAKNLHKAFNKAVILHVNITGHFTSYHHPQRERERDFRYKRTRYDLGNLTWQLDTGTEWDGV